jgi:opacity protein-like surface antigen
MRRGVSGLALALVLAGGVTAPAAGQIGFVVGGGASIPVGDFGDYAGTGWVGMAGVRLSFPLIPVQLRADGLYAQNGSEAATTDKVSHYGGLANVIFEFGIPLSPIKPYLIGGVGYLNQKFSPGNSGLPEVDEWKVAFGGGAGVNVSLLVVGFFVEARYLKRDDTAFVPVMAGIRLGG